MGRYYSKYEREKRVQMVMREVIFLLFSQKLNLIV